MDDDFLKSLTSAFVDGHEPPSSSKKPELLPASAATEQKQVLLRSREEVERAKNTHAVEANGGAGVSVVPASSGMVLPVVVAAAPPGETGSATDVASLAGTEQQDVEMKDVASAAAATATSSSVVPPIGGATTSDAPAATSTTSSSTTMAARPVATTMAVPVVGTPSPEAEEVEKSIAGAVEDPKQEDPVKAFARDRFSRSYGVFIIQRACKSCSSSSSSSSRGAGGPAGNFPSSEVPQRVMITACHIFQTYFCYCAFDDHDIRYAALACINMANKAEENRLCTLRSLVTTNLHWVFAAAPNTNTNTSSTADQMNMTEPNQDAPLNLPAVATVVKRVVRIEKRMMRVLGFELNEFCSFAEGHCHNILYAWGSELASSGPLSPSPELQNQDKDMKNLQKLVMRILHKSIGYANDSLRTTLCCRQDSHIIAAACWNLACREERCKDMIPSTLAESDQTTEGSLFLQKQQVLRAMREIQALYTSTTGGIDDAALAGETSTAFVPYQNLPASPETTDDEQQEPALDAQVTKL
ncbi:unnamed protein product [Amoebophrya sp. A25]|nr:unnamed protein product [Amoebophrya sp. A25]|eukprot:GSA25T00001597001.1